MGRIMSIWIPSLPLDRLIRLGDPRTNGVFAIIAEQKNAWRLTHVNMDAARRGLKPGQTLADARAICPDLLTEAQNAASEGALLRALWRWAGHLSPAIALDEPDGLIVDITGCAHLFGGELEMAKHVIAELTRLKVSSRIALADTKHAASALARFGANPITIAPVGKTHEALRSIPIKALNIDSEIAVELARTGLKSIGQLYAIKSSELARRFGLDLVKAIGAALGYEPDPVAPASAEPIYAARATLPEPIGHVDDLTAVLERLAASVCERLSKAQKGARRFRLTVRCVDNGDQELCVGFARPCADAPRLLHQFASPLEKLKVEFGADWFRLVAECVEALHPVQIAFGDQPNAQEALERLITSLGNDLGFERIRRFESCDSHLPHREFKTVEAANSIADLAWKRTPRKRPLRLFRNPELLKVVESGRPPVSFEWRKSTYSSLAASGPERLTPAWWDDEDGRTRDYWKVQTQQGPRLWLLTYPGTGGADWFVAGRFP